KSGSGKTYGIYNEIKDFIYKEVDGKVILLVPEQFTLESEYNLINQMKLEGLLNVEVLSFSRLMDRIFDETGHPDKKEINHLGKTMILKKIFDENKEKLSIFSSIYNQNGFISLFSDLIGELKRSGIYEENILELKDGVKGDVILSSKLADISTVYVDFLRKTKDLYMDDEDKFDLLIDKINASELVAKSYIYIDGFSGFTFQEMRIIEELIRFSKSVTIKFLYETIENSSIFEPSIRNLDRFRAIAKKWDIKEKKKTFTYDDKNFELNHIKDNFFRYPFEPYKSLPKDISIDIDSSFDGEIERVASEIVTLVRDEGARWKDIAVVCSTFDSYESVIKRIFNEYQIPFFIDNKRTIMNSPLVKVIISSLRAVTSGFKYEHVFRLAKTAYIGLEVDDIHRLENYVIANGIRGKKWNTPIDISEYPQEIEDARIKLIEPLNKFKASLKKSICISDIIKSILEYTDSIDLYEKLNISIEKLKEENRFEYVNEYSQIWNILMDLFEQAVEIIGDQKMNITDFTDMIEAGMREFKIGIIPPTMDKVLVGTIERTKSHGIDYMYIIGMNEGCIPSNRSDYGILVDEDKMKMISEGALIKSDLKTIEEDEALAFYSVLSRPSKKLKFSYPISNSDGKSLRTSIYVDRLKKLFPFLSEDSHIIEGLSLEKQITNPASTLKYLVASFRDWIDTGSIEARWFEVYKWYIENSGDKEGLDHIISGLFHDNQVETIGKKHAIKLYDLPLRSSVSRIEKFVNCPFAHFVKYGLRPKERSQYEIKMPDIGIIFHESIEKFGEKIFENRLNLDSITKDNSDQMIDHIIEDMTKEYGNYVFESSYRYKYLINKIKRVGRRSAWTIINHIMSGEFDPMAYEIKFGDDKEDSIPPFIIELPNGEKIFLEGRIDRIDIFGDDDKTYAKIIDYKSGSKAFSFSDAFNGLEIQLLLYMDAVLQNSDFFKVDKVYPGGAFYFKIDDPLLNGDNVDIKELENEIFKSLKLDGVVVKDVHVVNAMDAATKTNSKSDILPVDFKKDGDFSSTSKAISEPQFLNMLSHVKEIVVDAGTQIIEGVTKVEPIKDGARVACEYCEYKGICQFDTRFEDNKYKSLKKYTKKEVLELLDEREESKQSLEDTYKENSNDRVKKLDDERQV
ncbi:MAG: helicase-exonuclease AddAB subunit AddB, partial [Acidaminobacteraceae bacterium]